ncbi:MAG TPA: OB-fold nucleic acid binding domain-containing protein, partial [Albitalea sp.]
KVLLNDARQFGIDFEPPDVNRGTYRFEPVGDKLVRYGLGAIKGTGQGAIEAIVAAREEGEPFRSLFDFCARVDRTRINKRVVEALIKAGAFDSLHPDRTAGASQAGGSPSGGGGAGAWGRPALLASVTLALDWADTQAAHADQGGLFDFGDSHAASTHEPSLLGAEPWSVKERLGLEKTALGFYLSGHLFDQSEAEVRQFARRRIADLVDSREPQLVAGIVGDLRVVNGQRGRVAIFKLDDRSASIEAVADEKLLDANRELLRDDELVVVSARVQPDRFSGGLRLNVQQLWDLPTARCRFGRYLQVRVNGSAPPVAQMLREFPARRIDSEEGATMQGLPVRLLLERERAQGELDLGEASRFFPSDAALASWTRAACGNARIIYATEAS